MALPRLPWMGAEDAPVSPSKGQRLDWLQGSGKRRFGEKVFLAALGAIPWVGGFIAAIASYKLEGSAAETNELQNQWLEEHEHKMDNLRFTLSFIGDRLESLGPEIEMRRERGVSGAGPTSVSRSGTVPTPRTSVGT